MSKDQRQSPDGDIRISQVTVEGNTMVHVQKGDSARGEKDTKIVRCSNIQKYLESIFKSLIYLKISDICII